MLGQTSDEFVPVHPVHGTTARSKVKREDLYFLPSLLITLDVTTLRDRSW